MDYRNSIQKTNTYDQANNPKYDSKEVTSPDVLEYRQGDDGKIIITGLRDDKLEALVIPEQIIGADVVALAMNSIEGCHYLRSIVIPKTVKMLEGFSINSCHTLSRVTINSEEILIPDYAFRDCPKLAMIDFPAIKSDLNLSLYPNSFSGTAIPTCTYRGGKYLSLASSPYFALIGPENDDVTSCELHPDTFMIACGAFTGAIRLRSLTLTGKIHAVPMYAFSDCTALEEIVFDERIGGVNTHAFSDCTAIEHLSIPGATKIMGFDGCSSLKTMLCPKAKSISPELLKRVKLISENDYKKILSKTPASSDDTEAAKEKRGLFGKRDSGVKFDKKMLEYSVSSGEITITGIKDKSVKYIDIPDHLDGHDVCYIAKDAFSECKSAEELDIPKTVKRIDARAFSGMTSLTEVVIRSESIDIGAGAFSGCHAIESVKFTSLSAASEVTLCTDSFDSPKIVTTHKGGRYLSIIKNKHFALIGAEEDTTKRCELHKDTVAIAKGAFNGHKKLEQLVLEGDFKAIPADTFADCTALRAAIFGNNVKTLGKDAFRHCTALKRLDVPFAVSVDGFDGCTNLQVISLPAVKELHSTFINCPNIEKLTLGAGISFIQRNALADCKSLHTIELDGIQANWKSCYSHPSIKAVIDNATQIKKIKCTDGTVRLRWF